MVSLNFIDKMFQTQPMHLGAQTIWNFCIRYDMSRTFSGTL